LLVQAGGYLCQVTSPNQQLAPVLDIDARLTEIERTLAKLPELSQHQQDAIHALSAAIVNKLLHQPITSMKNPDSGGQLARVVQQLFQLTETS
jgi:glutamyl-tRNA reductase